MKKIISIVLIIALMAILLGSLSACSNDSKVVNEWICDIRDSTHKNYPIVLNLFKDGTGILNEYGGNSGSYLEWSVGNGYLYLGQFLGQKAYHISFEGDTMYLDDFSYHIREAGEEPPEAPRYTLKTK